MNKMILCRVHTLVSLSCLFFSFSFSALANLTKAPPSISLQGNRGKAVFVDFTSADYHLTYDVSKASAVAESTIHFENSEAGFAIFDLVAEPLSISVDGQEVKAILHSIAGVTEFRYADINLAPGPHVMKIKNQIRENVIFGSSNVRSAFWTSDLDDRSFLEQYLPSNFEFDQYKMNLHLKVVGTEVEHEVFTNAAVTNLAKNEWQLDAPAYFNTSSLFFHLTQSGLFRKLNFSYRSIDGREIPVVVYGSSDLATYQSRLLSVLKELENDYGPFPHQKVVVYGAGSGGMEYCGATISSLYALEHELTHSYFARGVMPASGNSGWVDEAMASWRDARYRQSSLESLSTTRMSGHSVYTRMTDDDAYTKGERFMGYLDKMFTAKGGLKKFMRDMVEKRMFKPFLIQDFQNDLELYFNQSLSMEFNKYIYGKGALENVKTIKGAGIPNPFHPKLSKQQLRDLL